MAPWIAHNRVSLTMESSSRTMAGGGDTGISKPVLNKEIFRPRSAPTKHHYDDDDDTTHPALVALVPLQGTNTSSMPSVDATEATIEEETLIRFPTISTRKLTNADLSSVWMAREAVTTCVLRLFQSIRAYPEDHPVFCAVIGGIMLPSSWIIMLGLGFVLWAIFRIASKWWLYHWNSRDVRFFRRMSLRVYQRLTVEMERTMQGDYSRQVVASLAFWACTAPGESTLGKFLRWQTSRINSRFIEEMEAARERYIGYRGSKHKYSPFA